jgi:hypothetical protein
VVRQIGRFSSAQCRAFGTVSELFIGRASVHLGKMDLQRSLPAIAQNWSNIVRLRKITIAIAFYCPLTTDSCHGPERYALRTRNERYPFFSVFVHNISKPVNNPVQSCEG